MKTGNTKLLVTFVAAVIIIAGTLTIYSTMSRNGEDMTLYEVVDGAGNKIALDEVPERIVSMDAISTEMLCELGFTKNIVGVSSNEGVHNVTDFIYGLGFDIWYPNELLDQIAKGKTVLVGSSTQWTTDQVLNCNPDLVVFSSTANNIAKMKALQEMGITCIVSFNPVEEIETIYSNMEILGKALGKSDRAKQFNDGMREIVEFIYETCNGFEGKDVIMVSAPGTAYYAYGETNLKHVVLRAMGCTTNMAGTATGIVTAEHFLQKQPDIIIFDPMGNTMNMSTLKETLEADPLWSDVNAMKNNKAYYLEYSVYQASGYYSHHFVHGIAMMATIVFEELNVEVPQLVEDDRYLDYISWLDREH